MARSARELRSLHRPRIPEWERAHFHSDEQLSARVSAPRFASVPSQPNVANAGVAPKPPCPTGTFVPNPGGADALGYESQTSSPVECQPEP